MQELEALDAGYRVVGVQEEFDQELPADLDGSNDAPAALLGAELDGRLTMRDVILAKKGSTVRTGETDGAHYTTHVQSPASVGSSRSRSSAGGSRPRSRWAARRPSFRFVNTHLEAFGEDTIREAQAKELFAPGGPLDTDEQVILAGDLNSGTEARHNIHGTDQLAFAALLGFGMTDNGAIQSCCYSDLFDPTQVFDHTVDHVLTKPGLQTKNAFVTGNDPAREDSVRPLAIGSRRSGEHAGAQEVSGFGRRALSGCALAVALALGGLAPAAYSQSPPDFSSPGEAWNILPPGESGNNPPNPNSLNQALLYNGLTPLFDQVTDSDLPNFFKPNIFGLGSETPVSVVQPRPGLRIERDSKGVAHVFGDTRADVMYGAGWVTVEDRDQPGAPLMEALRGPGRVAALDVPGIDPFSLVFSGRQFTPSAETEAFLAQQLSLLQSAGPEGQQVVQDIDDYLQGINDRRRFPARRARAAMDSQRRRRGRLPDRRPLRQGWR